MCPIIYTPLGDIPTFKLFVAVGVAVMLIEIYFLIKKDNNIDEAPFIYPRIVIAGILGFGFAILFDSVFKYIKYGVFKVYGMAFFGGLIGAVVSLYIMLKISKIKTAYTITEWFNLVTIPFMCFHFFGRIGCFFGGCCYGKCSSGIFTVVFPDNLEMGIIHNGVSRYPTQLFEAISVLAIFFIVLCVKDKFKWYLFLYSIARFLLEFLRGDDRGRFLPWLSPSQILAVIIILFSVAIFAAKYVKSPKKQVE